MKRAAIGCLLLALLLAGCNFTTFDLRRPLVIDTVPRDPAKIDAVAALYPGDRAKLEKSLADARTARRYFGVSKRDERDVYHRIGDLASAIETMPDNPFAWIQLGAYLALSHQTAAAIDATERGLKSIEKACRDEPCSALERLRVIGSLNLAIYYTSAGRPLEASFALDQLDPEKLPAFYALAYYWHAADAAMRLRDVEYAESALRSARELKPDESASFDQKYDYPQYFAEKRDAIQSYLEGQLALEQGEYAKAVTALETAGRLDKELWDARLALGNVRFAEGRYDDTIAVLKKLDDEAPDNTLFRPEIIHFNLGNAYYERWKKSGNSTDLDLAAGAYARADEIVRDRFSRARRTTRKSDAIERDEAVAGFFVDALAVTQTVFGDALNNAGLVEHERSRITDDPAKRVHRLMMAEENWRRALGDAQWRQRHLAYTNLTRVYAETDRLAAAADAAQHALSLNRRNIASLQALVEVVRTHRDPAEAARTAYAAAMLIDAHYDPGVVPLAREWLDGMGATLSGFSQELREVRRARLAIEIARAGIDRVPASVRELEGVGKGVPWALMGVAASEADVGQAVDTAAQLARRVSLNEQLDAVIRAPLDSADWMSSRERGEAFALRGRMRLEREDLVDARLDFEHSVGNGVDRYSIARPVGLLRDALAKASLPAVGSVAVLPFRTLAADEALWPRAFAGELAAVVRGVANVSVVAVQPDAGSAVAVESGDTSRRHAAGAAVTGSLSIEDGIIVADVLAQDALDEETLFAKRYRSTSDALQQLLREIAGDVLGALRIPLRPEGERVAQAFRNAKAFHHFLRGQEALLDLDREGMMRARDEFGRAARLDRNFSAAHAGVALARYGVSNLYERATDVMPAAVDAAEKAVRADPKDPAAQLALAMVRTWYEWKLDAGKQAFLEALKLDPENAIAHRLYGDLLLARGKPDEIAEAEKHKRRAVELAPLSPAAQLGLAWAHFYAGRHADALRQARHALTLDPTSERAYFFLSWLYAYTGDYGAARVALKMAMRSGETPLTRSHLAVIDARDNHPAAARQTVLRLVEEARAGDSSLADFAEPKLGIPASGMFEGTPRPVSSVRSDHSYVLPLFIARIYAALGEFNSARDWLEAAADDRSESIVWLPVDPWFEPLRGPGLQQMIDRVRP